MNKFGKVVDEVRKSEFEKASADEQKVLKGSKTILLSNYDNLKEEGKEHLERILEMNTTICLVLILRDSLKNIWTYRTRSWARKKLTEWYELAESLDIPELNKLVNCLRSHEYGILNHCEFAISNGRLEGTNNKIKVIKRKAYGYNDDKYFTLKVKQATDPIKDN